MERWVGSHPAHMAALLHFMGMIATMSFSAALGRDHEFAVLRLRTSSSHTTTVIPGLTCLFPNASVRAASPFERTGHRRCTLATIRWTASARWWSSTRLSRTSTKAGQVRAPAANASSGLRAGGVAALALVRGRSRSPLGLRAVPARAKSSQDARAHCRPRGQGAEAVALAVKS